MSERKALLIESNAIERKVKNGEFFDSMIDKADNFQKSIKKDADVEFTVDFMQFIINEYYQQVSKLADYLRAKSEFETCKNIFNFCYDYIKYNLERGELLKTPARIWYDSNILHRQTKSLAHSSDCDDFTVFVCCLLKNLGIPYKIRVAGYSEMGNYQHVYAIAKINNQDIIIDAVTNYFNYQKPPFPKGNFKDYEELKLTHTHKYMKMNGLGTLNSNIQLLGNVGDINGLKEKLIALKDKIRMFFKMRKFNPFSGYTDDLNGFLGQLDRLIEAEDFGAVLGDIIEEEQTAIKNGTLRPYSNYLNYEFEDTVEDLDGLGNLPENVFTKEINGDILTAEFQGFFGALADSMEYDFAGLGDLAGRKERRARRLARKKARWQKKGKLNEKLAKYKEREKRKEERKEKGGALHFINRYNPATIAMREGLKMAIKLNFRGLATLISRDNQGAKYQKALNIFKKIGGKKANFDKVINIGKNKKPLLKKDLQGLGVEPAITTMIASAFGVIASFFKIFKRKDKKNDDTNANEFITTNTNSNIIKRENIKMGQSSDNGNGNNGNGNNDKKNNKKIIAILIILALLGTGGYLIYNQSKKTTPTKKTKTLSGVNKKATPTKKTKALSGVNKKTTIKKSNLPKIKFK